MEDVPELPEVEALAADLRERAAGQVIDGADVTEFSVLKTYDPPLSALRGRVVTGAGRYGKFLDLVTGAPAGGPPAGGGAAGGGAPQSRPSGGAPLGGRASGRAPPGGRPGPRRLPPRPPRLP